MCCAIFMQILPSFVLSFLLLVAEGTLSLLTALLLRFLVAELAASSSFLATDSRFDFVFFTSTCGSDGGGWSSVADVDSSLSTCCVEMEDSFSGSGMYSSSSSIGLTLAVPGREQRRDWPRSREDLGRCLRKETQKFIKQ